MKQPYLVIGTEDIDEKQVHNDFAVIEAEDAEEAKKIFIQRVGIHDSTFLDSVYDRSINMSYAELFFRPLFNEYLEWVVPEEEIDIHFMDNVRRFFKEHTEWAELYIQFVLDGKDLKFPEDMLSYMLANYNNYVKYIVVPLESIWIK